MKRFLALLGFLLVTFTVVVAQGNGNSGNNNTTTNYSNPWANYNLSPAEANYVQNGGPIPMSLVAKVLGAVKVWGFQNFGLSLSGMMQQYNAGKLTITLVATSPPSLTFWVSYSGIGITIVIDDF